MDMNNSHGNRRRVGSASFTPFHRFTVLPFPVYLFTFLLIMSGCHRQQPKSFVNVLDSNDSLNIAMGDYTTVSYHSQPLDLDIQYPSYLRHEYVEDHQMEVFKGDNNLSMSFMVQDLEKTVVYRVPSQAMMGMGAELVEAGDGYSIHTGQDGKMEYYGKVIDDLTRTVTVMLRYLPKHAEAAAPLRQYVHDYQIQH